MARVKLRCVVGYPGLKSSYREKGLKTHVITRVHYSMRFIHLWELELDWILIAFQVADLMLDLIA